nr:MFS transporter [Marivita sp.]
MSYGPARMGFGLFVPEFKSAFSLSSTAVGLISGLGFFGFFLGLILAEALLIRAGPRLPVLSGLAAALAGLACVALAQSPASLALGVFLAASSAGFAWTPFNDPVHRKIRDQDRPSALARISTGTSLGIALAGLVGIGTVWLDLHWRAGWAVFAGAAAAALVINAFGLRDIDMAPRVDHGLDWRDLLRARAHPLFAMALVFGIVSGIYIAFAADHFWNRGGLDGVPTAITPGLVFVFFGLFGLSGLLTGNVKDRLGLPWLLRGLMLCGAVSLILVAAAAGTWIGLIASAGLQGIFVMMTSAVLALWSERLFPDAPALSFTTTLLAVATGNMLGPVTAGWVSDTFSPEVMLIGAAILPALAAGLLRKRHAVERP